MFGIRFHVCLSNCDKENKTIYADLKLKEACLDVMNGAVEKALAELQEAKEIDPGIAEIYLVEMEIYSTLGKTDTALESLKQYISLTGDESLYETVAKTYAELGDSEASIDAYKRYLDGMKLEEGDKLYLLGSYLMEVKAYVQAAELFEGLIGNETYGTASLYNLGICAIQTGDAEKALAWFKACKEDGGTYSGIEYHIGLCQLMLGNIEEAEAGLLRSIAVPEEEFIALARFNIGLVRIQREQFEEAIASFNEIGDAIETVPETYFYRAACEGALGKMEAALADYTKCIELGVDTAQSYYQQAQLYAALGDEEHKLEDLAKSIETK